MQNEGIGTIGEAHDLGWKLRAYCRHGNRDGMKSIRECTWSIDLHLPTLVATRGRAFPLASVGSRLKCIRCGSMRVSVIFEPPTIATESRARASR